MKANQELQIFLKKHCACSEGKRWALENCETLQEVWGTAKPEWLLWVATRPGVLGDKELRLFACWCCKQIWGLLPDERSRNAVMVAEKFANGESTEDELHAARDAARDAACYVTRDAARAACYVTGDAARAAAWDVARAAAWAAARDAARDAARAAARAAAWAAARDAARAAAWDAAWAAARDAARAAAWDAARDAQANYLRTTCTPFSNGC